MKEIIIDGVTYTLTPKEEVLVFGKYKIGSCVVSLESKRHRKEGDVFKVLENSTRGCLEYGDRLSLSICDDYWRQATEQETAEYEKRGGTYNISELKPKLPKTWEELKIIDGWFVRGASIIEEVEEQDTITMNKNIFATKEQAEASIALAQLSQLLKVYRENWTPNWSDNEQKKWCIYFHSNELYNVTFYQAHHFLSFPTQELAQEFLDNFRDLIEKAKPLL